MWVSGDLRKLTESQSFTFRKNAIPLEKSHDNTGEDGEKTASPGYLSECVLELKKATTTGGNVKKGVFFPFFFFLGKYVSGSSLVKGRVSGVRPDSVIFWFFFNDLNDL